MFISFSKFLFVVTLVAGPYVMFAQQAEVNTSPYHVITNHLRFLQEDNFDPGQSARSIHGPNLSPKKKEEQARLLKRVLDGKGLYIDPAKLPNSPDFLDTASNLHRYYLAPTIYPTLFVEQTNGKWYYTQSSLSHLDEWYADAFPLGGDKFLEDVLKGGNKYFGLYPGQYIALFIVVLLAFLLHKVFTLVVEKIIIRILLRMGHTDLARRMVLSVARPVSILVIFPLLTFSIPLLQLPVKLSSYIILGLKVIWPVFAVVFFYRLVDVLSLYLQKLASKTESTLDDQLVPLLRKSLKTFVVIIGVLVILQNLDINVTGIIAGLSIGGLAFALAAQDTIKNFFGSLMIFFDRPFQVGDWITSGDIDGTVEEVGFRATRIRTFRNSVMYIPNGVITNQMIDNHGLRVYRRFYTKIAITYDTPAELIEVFTDGLKEIVKNHADTRKDYFEVHLNNLADSSLEIMFYIFFAVPNWTEELRARHEVILLVIKLAEELGVNFAFPTQTLHVESLPEGKTRKTEYVKSSPALKKKVEEFLKKEMPKEGLKLT